jgi:hypothetical protein
MDLYYARSLLKQLDECYWLWKLRTVLQSDELPLMSARGRILPCCYHEVRNTVWFVVSIAHPLMKVWPVSEICDRRNIQTDKYLLACHIKIVWNIFNVTKIGQLPILRSPDWHMRWNAVISHITVQWSESNVSLHLLARI